jgi:hypothetical protein
MRVFTFLSVFFCIITSFQEKNPRIYVADLKRLTGEKWIGQLTYLDYSSNKKTSIKANLQVSRSASDNQVWYFKNEYPLEPKANSIDTLIISVDGKMLDDEKVIERTRVNKTAVRIITRKNSVDNGKEKIFRYTYNISDKTFSIKKEEKNKNDVAFIERNVYEFKR